MLNYKKFEDIATENPYLMSTIVKVFLMKLNSTLITKNILNLCASNPGW